MFRRSEYSFSKPSLNAAILKRVFSFTVTGPVYSTREPPSTQGHVSSVVKYTVVPSSAENTS